MTARLTVNLNPESAALLNAIKANARASVFKFEPTNTDIVARGLALLAGELGIRGPVTAVTTDRANEEDAG